MSDVYGIKCTGHNYITLTRNGAFVRCYDNDMTYAEEIIFNIENYTGQKFSELHIIGKKSDFSGLRFFNGGWKRKFWEEFPSQDEIVSYIKLKRGGK